MLTESALHLLGRVTSRVGLLLCAPLAVCALASPSDPELLRAWLLATCGCLSVGWGLRSACAFTPGVFGARTTRLLLAGGGLLALLIAALPFLLAAGAVGAPSARR